MPTQTSAACRDRNRPIVRRKLFVTAENQTSVPPTSSRIAVARTYNSALIRGDVQMVAVTFDSKLRSQFADAPAQVEVRDEQGQFLGYFIPAWLGTPEDYPNFPNSRHKLLRRNATAGKESTGLNWSVGRRRVSRDTQPRKCWRISDRLLLSERPMLHSVLPNRIALLRHS
jgi:hypothetical protein